GVIQSLEMFKKNGFKIGLASSSPARMIGALVDHFGIREYFDEITSADVVSLGKPHPAVFMHCAEALGSRPIECVVLEDSVNGCISGKAARMKVIAIPDELHFDDPRFMIADAKLRSLESLDMEVVKRL